nr:hypothetical protein P5648_22105 [Bacillus subtilis]
MKLLKGIFIIPIGTHRIMNFMFGRYIGNIAYFLFIAILCGAYYAFGFVTNWTILSVISKYFFYYMLIGFCISLATSKKNA